MALRVNHDILYSFFQFAPCKQQMVEIYSTNLNQIGVTACLTRLRPHGG